MNKFQVSKAELNDLDGFIQDNDVGSIKEHIPRHHKRLDDEGKIRNERVKTKQKSWIRPTDQQTPYNDSDDRQEDYYDDDY